VFAVSIISAIIALMMKAANNSEMSVNFYQTIRSNNPENSLLHYTFILKLSVKQEIPTIFYLHDNKGPHTSHSKLTK
jgi:hypothetical protein